MLLTLALFSAKMTVDPAPGVREEYLLALKFFKGKASTLMT